jgi:putative transposase
VKVLCQVLEISRQAYYIWLNKKAEPEDPEPKKLLKRIKEIHEASKGSYGSLRILAALKSEGIHVNHKKLEAIMSKNGIKAKRKQKFKATTNSKHNKKISENLLNRDFSPAVTNKAWVSDITYGAPRPLVGVHISGMQTKVEEVDFKQ